MPETKVKVSSGVLGLWITASVTVLVLTVLLLAATEFICAKKGEAFRWPMYGGGIAGFAMNLLALPFALKMAGMTFGGGRDTMFWVLWGGGFLVRLFGFGVSAFVLIQMYPGFETPALVTLMAIFLPGMFVESGWLSRRFFAAQDALKRSESTGKK